MGKQLLLLTIACIVLSAMVAGCGYGNKVHSQKNTAKTTVDPKITDSIYAVNHPRNIIGKNWTALKQSHLSLLSAPSVPENKIFDNISLIDEPTSFLAKNGKKRSGKSKAVISGKAEATEIKKGKNGKQDNNAKNDVVAAVALGKQGIAKTNEPVAIETGKPDSVETQAGNGKADTAEPFAVAISKPAENIENNPAPVNDGAEETVEAKPLTGPEMEALVGKYAVMVNVEPKEITNFSLYRFVDEWYGTEYKWGGEDNTGIDCSAFSQKLYEEVYGVDILRTAREQHRSCERIKNLSEASQGDLVFFRIRHIRISHVGIYLANGYFVHASSSQGVVISNLRSKYWRRRFAGCGRIVNEDPDTESENIP